MGDEEGEAPAAPVPKQALIVLTSTTELPDGTPTGFWLGEATHPYFQFVASGWEVTFASVGGTALADESSLGSNLDAETKAFWEDEEKKALQELREVQWRLKHGAQHGNQVPTMRRDKALKALSDNNAQLINRTSAVEGRSSAAEATSSAKIYGVGVVSTSTNGKLRLKVRKLPDGVELVRLALTSGESIAFRRKPGGVRVGAGERDAVTDQMTVPATGLMN